MLDAILAIFLVEVNDGLGIALGSITMAARDQSLAQRTVVIDFTVENYPDRTIFVAERLMSVGDVDDAEAAHAEADIALRENAVIVWTAMGHHIAHPSQDDRVGVSVLAELEYSRNATHNLFCNSPGFESENPTKARNQ